ncbi:bile acid:sodium symporter family protein [Rummeliibacillus sp. TYF005]|uniref:bile acid:sodium symporter family protein n=1 Tax=Rummeliibacillus sp. TYF005 TaxID=2058214 RepID=UPI000F53A9D3|nr:bile acid:sodium symporter family protein [Rummeliibacillus sp. TYF005]RPJ95195.1 bile acid:sodium symporter family protein [Rummeliibacillus sp. TYF005]
MLEKVNRFLQKYIAILTPLSLVVGVLLENVGHHFVFLVAWLFAFMTFTSSLKMKFKDVNVFRKHPLFILFAIIFLHVLMPLWAFFLSTVIFDDHLLTVGFVISVAVPTGITSVIWISICKGNLPLGLSVILIDTLLSPFIMPLLLYVVSGEKIQLDVSELILDLVVMIVLPTILGILVNELSKGEIPKKIGKKLAPFSKIALLSIIMINSSAIAPFIKDLNLHLVGVILLVFAISVSGYSFALLIGRFIIKNHQQTTALVFTGGMRNIAIGVIVATTYFPSKVAMPVVFGMLFQQVLASLFSKIVMRNASDKTEQLQ